MRLLLILIGAFAVMVGAALVVPRVLGPENPEKANPVIAPEGLTEFSHFEVYRSGTNGAYDFVTSSPLNSDVEKYRWMDGFYVVAISNGGKTGREFFPEHGFGH